MTNDWDEVTELFRIVSTRSSTYECLRSSNIELSGYNQTLISRLRGYCKTYNEAYHILFFLNGIANASQMQLRANKILQRPDIQQYPYLIKVLEEKRDNPQRDVGGLREQTCK